MLKVSLHFVLADLQPHLPGIMILFLEKIT